jgi:hypothetical protein
MCATLGDYLYPLFRTIIYRIAMLHFVLFHDVTCVTLCELEETLGLPLSLREDFPTNTLIISHAIKSSI